MRINCISKLPSAGLGNKLFSWASGVVFSKRNNCRHFITGMTKIHLGPLLRGEYSKRFYRGYFNNEYIILPIRLLFYKPYQMLQVESDQIVKKPGVYVFSEIPHWSDEFKTLKEYRTLIKDSFFESLSSKIKQQVSMYVPPVIAVHIRMGDFRPLKVEEDFSKLGGVRTPITYFINIINQLRKVVGTSTPVTIFSDGDDIELSEILSLNNVKRVQNDYDIVHLVVMSMSKILIMSSGSTFSHWAGFLSDEIIINHFQHAHSPIRPLSINQYKYEGVISPMEELASIPLLYKNLLSLKQDI